MYQASCRACNGIPQWATSHTVYTIQYSTVYSIQYMCIRVLVGPVIEYHSGPPVIQYTPIHYSIQFTEFGTAADFKNRLALKTQHKK